MALPSPPPEVAAVRSLDQLAPKFRAALESLLADLQTAGWTPVVLESFRTDEREQWLYGFGRDYDDGRGVVTNSPDGRKSWHRYGLAADLGTYGHEDGMAPEGFYRDLMHFALLRGLTSGRDWNRNGIPDSEEAGKHFCDGPHVQWYIFGMHASPSDHAWDLLSQGGPEAVWKEVQAD